LSIVLFDVGDIMVMTTIVMMVAKMVRTTATMMGGLIKVIIA